MSNIEYDNDHHNNHNDNAYNDRTDNDHDHHRTVQHNTANHSNDRGNNDNDNDNGIVKCAVHDHADYHKCALAGIPSDRGKHEPILAGRDVCWNGRDPCSGCPEKTLDN